MKNLKYYVSDFVDVIYLVVLILFFVKYGVLNWHPDNGWLFLGVVIFYQVVVMIRLGKFRKALVQMGVALALFDKMVDVPRWLRDQVAKEIRKNG